MKGKSLFNFQANFRILFAFDDAFNLLECGFVDLTFWETVICCSESGKRLRTEGELCVVDW